MSSSEPQSTAKNCFSFLEQVFIQLFIMVWNISNIPKSRKNSIMNPHELSSSFNSLEHFPNLILSIHQPLSRFPPCSILRQTADIISFHLYSPQ